MKQYTEITLENIGALKSMINGVKREANEKKDYIEKSVILVGKEAIEKAIEKYNISCNSYKWEQADGRVRNLKISGTAKFVYVACVEIYSDARWENSEHTSYIKYIDKAIYATRHDDSRGTGRYSSALCTATLHQEVSPE